MSASVIVLVIGVATAAPPSRDADQAYARGVEQAASEALGPDARVLSREVPAIPADAEAVAMGERLHADVVVEISWQKDHLRSLIRLERATTGQWVERELSFRPVDDPGERSRAVGLALASMLPEFAERQVTSAEPAAASTSPSPEGTEATAPPPSSPSPTPSSAAVVPRTVTRETNPPEDTGGGGAASHEPVVRHDHALTALFAAGFGSGAGDRSVGGFVDYRHAFSRSTWWRVGAGARLGQNPPAGVEAREYALCAGIAWSAWESPGGRAFLGLRLDALAVVDQFERRANGATSDQFKPIPGADAALEAGYFFTRAVAVTAGAGVEVRFGRTDVLVGEQQIARLSPLLPVLEVGLRIGF